MDFEGKIKSLKLNLPVITKPIGSYVPAVKSGNLVITSGQLPLSDGRLDFKGRVGKEVTTENAQRAAKIAVVNALAAVRWVTGDLNRIKKIVRMNCHVCSAIDYHDHARVANGASDLLLEIFGEEIGGHSRATVGVLELPMGSCVELDLMVEVR